MFPEEDFTPSLGVLTADIVFTSFSKRAETVSEVGRMPCKSCRERPERMGGGGGGHGDSPLCLVSYTLLLDAFLCAHLNGEQWSLSGATKREI